MLCLSWSFLDIGLRHGKECSSCADQQALVIEGVECNVVCAVRTSTLTGPAPRPFAS